MSFSTSPAVRYSLDRSSVLGGRVGTDRFSLRGLITRRCATIDLRCHGCFVHRNLGDRRRRGRRDACVHFFVATAALAHRGAMNNYWKYLLDGALVVLIIVLIWKSVRSWTHNRNDDRPD